VATLILLAVMFGLLWLFLIRPQRQRQMQQQRLLQSVEPGDEVLTVGGLYGIVQEIDEDDDLIVEIADGIHVRIARRAIGGVVKPDEEADDDGDEAIDEENGVDGVNDSEEIVSEEAPEDTAALDRR
jgi:preprotein translocase subunit YajC